MGAPDDGGKEPALMSLPAVILAGGLSGFTSRFATHPFDTVKTQMQVQGVLRPSPMKYKGVVDGAFKIFARDGPAGFYRGFGAVITGVPFASGAYFGGYETSKALMPESLVGATASYVGAGMVAQAAAGVVYTPMDVVKAQHVLGAASAGTYTNFVNAYQTIFAKEGVRGLFRGYWASNLTWWPWNIIYFVVGRGNEGRSSRSGVHLQDERTSRLPGPAALTVSLVAEAHDAASFFWLFGSRRARNENDRRRRIKRHSLPSRRPRPYPTTYEHGRNAASAAYGLGGGHGSELPPWASSACATAAAVTATVITTPIDMGKTRLQTLRVEPSEPPGTEGGGRGAGGGGAPVHGGRAVRGAGLSARAGVFQVVRDVAAKEGVGALFTGVTARVGAIAPGSAISFFVYESIKEWCASHAV